MSEQCPRCLSTRIGRNNYGKKAAGVVGAAAGVYGGYASAIAGARTGAVVGAMAGPVSGIGGAVIVALQNAVVDVQEQPRRWPQVEAGKQFHGPAAQQGLDRLQNARSVTEIEKGMDR